MCIILQTLILSLSPGVDGVMLRRGLLFWSSIDRRSLLLSSFSWLGVTATPIFTSAIKRLALSRNCCCLSSSFCVCKNVCYVYIESNFHSLREIFDTLTGNSSTIYKEKCSTSTGLIAAETNPDGFVWFLACSRSCLARSRNSSCRLTNGWNKTKTEM